MDLEKVKQLCNEYIKRHPFLSVDIEKSCEAKDFYEIKKNSMTRQERRAYQRMLAKKRKH